MNHENPQADLFDLPTAIAVVGMACRFPKARNLEEFRRNLENGVECITRFTDEELLQAGVDRKVLSDPNYVKAAPLLEDFDQFDASFFEFSPREATIMDPQQRLFLECAWEALEDAAHAGDAYGSRTGVFAGGGGVMSTYLLSDTHFNPQLTGTTASMQHVGNDKDYLSSRVSYKFNFTGPSFVVLSACSTSLVSIHLACQSLLNRECDMALAGGTSIRVPHKTGYLFKEGNVFSRDGHCRAFDADATGTVFGSGIGVVVLKRLKDAVADRDPIRAVIRGTAINNDGAENKISYWAPHAPGQADAMLRALAIAKVDPRTIGYVEAHGTATKKGDPTELRALTQAFGLMPPASCAIGSVKSNIGHPESAAGVAGLIKAVLSLEHKTLFPSLHYSRPNPEVDFDHGFYVNANKSHWERGPNPRRAGVNALGIGGTNAFAILEEAPDRNGASIEPDRPYHVLTLSAKTTEALDALAQRFSAHLTEHPTQSIGDICFSANVGRAHFSERLAVVASSADEAAQLVGSGASTGHIESSHVPTGQKPRIAFLFTGQGSQYVNMARELYRTNVTFRTVFDDCARKLSAHLERPLFDVLYPETDDPTPINETAFTQPALFAIEYALATLWRSWGVEPSILIGHSVGEIVAACVAGIIGLDDALRLTAERGRLMQSMPKGGGMAAVRCDAARAEAAISPYRETVSIAAMNGPTDVVISGRLDHLDAVIADLERAGIAATRLKVSHAFHSPLLDPMLADFARVARGITYSMPQIPVISNLTGQLATAEITTPDYWVRHVREGVRFAEGIQATHAQGVDVFLEVGPSPVLLGMARASVPQGPEAWLPSLRPGRSDWRQLAESLAALYVRGAGIDWAAVDRAYDRQRVHLPTYPFQRQRFWMDPPPIAAIGAPAVQPSLLGSRLRLPGAAEIRFEARWSPKGPAYLDDHRIFDTVVVPGASHIAMTLSAMREVAQQDSCVLEDIVFPQALTLADDATRTAQLILSTAGGRASAFEVMSLRDGEHENDPASWVVHATGKIQSGESARRSADPSAWLANCPRHMSGADFYQRFWESGYHLRGAFRWISQIHAGDGEILCELTWPELPDDPSEYPLYPSLIDSCFQCVFSDKASDLLRPDAVYVPFSIRRFELHGSPQPGQPLWCHIALSQPNPTARNSVDANITLCDASGQLVGSIEGCQLREVRREALVNELGKDLSDALYEVAWLAEPRRARSTAASEPGAWIVFGDTATKTAESLVERLTTLGNRTIRVDAAAAFRQIATDRYEIDATSAADMRRMLDETIGGNGLPCRGIVHLWSLETPPMNAASSAESRERVIGSVVHLVQGLSQIASASAPRLWLVTRGAQPVEAVPSSLAVQQAPLWGLGRVVALEHPELACVRVDLDPASDDLEGLLDDLLSPDSQDQLAYRQGTRYVPRLVRSTALKDRLTSETVVSGPQQIRLSSYGHLDNLVAKPLTRRSAEAGEVEIEVRAAGLNFRDVLIALGLMESHYAAHMGRSAATDMTFGFECAGTVVAVGEGVENVAVGDDVIAVATHDGLSSFVTLRSEFVVRKPASFTFEEAATIPLAFLTAYYGLDQLAKLKAGERVLIHAAAGGVGQACVQWAQQAGARVFATASPSKWPVLRNMGVENVMSSRTLEFGAAIDQLTGGEGVDVVINSLSGEFVDESFRVLKGGGRFVELGKREVWSEERARQERPDAEYFPFDLVEVSKREPKVIADMLAEMTARLESGTLLPLRHTIFPVTRATEAFRYMAEARHIGKIAIAMPPVAEGDEPLHNGIRPNASYLITGGLGALGLEIANRLVADGARHIALNSRREASGDAAAAIDRLKAAGANVVVIQGDVSDPGAAARVLAAIDEALPPLRGIVHAAGVLDDGVLLQQTSARFRKVLAPKVDGTCNLHALTERRPLDFFVLFSSIASMIGNAGQSNYAAGNACMDALAHYRRARGLAALSINWGPWADVGMAAEASGSRQRRLAEQGFRPIAPKEGVDAFIRLLRAERPQVGVLPISWPEFLRANPAGHAFFEKVATATPKAPPKSEPNIRKQLEEAADPRRVLTQHVRSVVSKVLGMRSAEEIDPRARLFDLGLESLMAVEMRGRFEETLGLSLRATLLFDYPTVEALAEHLLGRIFDRPAESTAPEPSAPAITEINVGELDELGEEELADRLARELLSTSRVQEQ